MVKGAVVTEAEKMAAVWAGVRVGVAMVLVVMMAAVMEWAAAAGRMRGMEGG